MTLLVEKETIQCGRCDEWFELEKSKIARIKKEGKVKEYLCPECDAKIKKGEWWGRIWLRLPKINKI